MTTTVRNAKIPHNVRRASVQDQVIGSSVRVQPGVRGSAYINKHFPNNPGATRRAGPGATAGGEKFATRYSRIADMLMTTTKGLDALIKIRDSAEAQQDPELAALANDPRVMAAFNAVIKAIGSAADDLIEKSMNAAKDTMNGPDYEGVTPESPNHQTTVPGANVTLDARLLPDTTNALIYYARKMELARKLASELLADSASGDAGDIVRAQHGYQPRVLKDDDLYAAIEGK